jgi:hypothetical protein
MRARPARPIVIGLITAAAALLGCATHPARSHAATTAASTAATGAKTAALPGKAGCFWLQNFDGSWTVLNDSELIVHAPSFSRPYLIKLFEPVLTLKFAQRLGFVDVEHSGMICNSAMDELIVPHWQPRRVPIVAVRQLTKPEERQLMVENHLEVPKKHSRPKKGNQAGKG